LWAARRGAGTGEEGDPFAADEDGAGLVLKTDQEKRREIEGKAYLRK
jgi:hypothetical protein